ncbi:MAG: SMP-30/gluconolactonase/LRE family protein, partial [Terriglobales bacterium]
MGFFTYLRRDLEQIVFKDRDPHAIPSMDGPFSPNDRLDRTTPIGEPLPGADAVAEAADGSICVSAGSKVWRLSGAGYQDRAVLAEFDSDVGALAFHPDGRLLACTASGLAAVDKTGCKIVLAEADGEALKCLSAVAVAPDGTIFVSDGSMRHGASDWCVDLMERNALGRILSCGPALDGARVLLRGLNYPDGLAVAPDGQLWFTEGFGHCLSRARISGPGVIATPETVIRNMPGYPSRLGRSAKGGFWLSL